MPSVLGVDFKFNDSHPECTGWTLYRKKTDEEWRKNYNQKSNFEYDVTYASFNPIKPESIIEAVDFMKEYAQLHYGSELITDFDGMEAIMK